MAYPLFGTTATHAAALFAAWGEARARKFFEALKANDVKILEGNMTVCRAVADGELALGLTDTDDAHLLQSQGRPVDFILLDHDGRGALLVPNTLALIKGAPHPEAGRKLIDYLLLPEVEQILATSPSAQIPLHPGVAVPVVVQKMAQNPRMPVDFAQAAAQLTPSADFLKSLFTRP
jgi:iron(III) transport system substrate-binding protein